MTRHGVFLLIFAALLGWLALAEGHDAPRMPTADHPSRRAVAACPGCHEADGLPAGHIRQAGGIAPAKEKCYLCH